MADSTTSSTTTQDIPRAVPHLKAPIRKRLRYRLDIALSRGPSVVILWLAMLTVGLILFTALLLTIFDLTGVNGDVAASLDLREAFWQSLTRVLDPGTFSGDVGWWTRVVGLFITLCGVLIAGSLIGLIANGIDQRLDELQKGRSDVLEEDHTVILGWSARVPSIVKELVIANESRKRAAIVIVADAEKSDIEETLGAQIDDFKTTRIVCRRGDPWLPRNLDLANVKGARSIIVVEEGSDASTVKVLLAIRAAQQGDPSPAHIVAEILDANTAKSLRSLMGSHLVTVSSDDVVAELTAQACRQRGLSAVFHELLDFDGDELYFAPFPELSGRTFADAQLSFEKCAVLGLLDSSGVVSLNPAADRVLVDGDQLIAVVEDDSLFLVAPISATPRVLPVAPPTRDETQRRIVIVGWSNLGPRVIAELDEFMDSRTTIELMLDPTKVDVEAVRAAVSVRNVNVEVSELAAGPEMVAEHAARISFNEVIVLGYREALDDNEADATTLLTLLAFRQVRQNEEVGPVRMVAELLDQRHAPLAEASGADDFIVSDELTSLMLAQLSERQELDQVFIDLFDREGCSIELRESAQYGAHAATTFADVVATASTKGHSAFGFRRAATGQVVVNPAKSAKLQLGLDDEILVLAPGIDVNQY